MLNKFLMNGEQSIILQVAVNQNLVITQLLMINATHLSNTIKIGLSLAELTNEETSNYINEIILSCKNNAKFVLHNNLVKHDNKP